MLCVHVHATEINGNCIHSLLCAGASCMTGIAERIYFSAQCSTLEVLVYWVLLRSVRVFGSKCNATGILCNHLIKRKKMVGNPP